jgi:hypothetical protein
VTNTWLVEGTCKIQVKPENSFKMPKLPETFSCLLTLWNILRKH